jgi:hypothetical protein
MRIGRVGRARLTAAYDQIVSASADTPGVRSAAASRRWVEQLHRDHPLHEQAVARREDPSDRFPGPGCRADHDGVLEAVRRFGDVDPDQPRR